MKKPKQKEYKSAFTLTEVLLAVAIVGIIAALVLPMVSTHYQNELYNHAYKREIDTIESAVEGLSVNENKANFFDTMMYTSSEPDDYKESSEKFLRKYVKTTKICSEAKDCFAQEYYEYTKDEQNRNVKKEYKPEYKGSCGILKNGMSICITPQIGGEGIHGIIDLNGKKGPNVHNRDLREFSLSSRTRVGMNTETEAVRSLDWENMGEDPPVDPCEGLTCGCGSLPACNPCDTDPTGLSCCKTKTITDSNNDCCTYDEIKNANDACNSTVNFALKFDCKLRRFQSAYGGSTYQETCSGSGSFSRDDSSDYVDIYLYHHPSDINVGAYNLLSCWSKNGKCSVFSTDDAISSNSMPRLVLVMCFNGVSNCVKASMSNSGFSEDTSIYNWKYNGTVTFKDE